MKVLLLVNHEAGDGRAVRALPQVLDLLHKRLPNLEAVRVDSAAEVRNLAVEAAGTGYDRVVVAGGDGTAHQAVNGLRGSRTVLGMIPLGHGNDLCRALGIPLDPVAAAEFLLRAPVAALDLVQAGEDRFATVASFGLDAETNRRANAWPHWPTGHWRYLLAGLRTLLRFRSIQVEMVFDADVFSGRAMWVAFANTCCYGGGIRIAPQARAADGFLDICVVEELSRREVLELYPLLYSGSHLAHPRVCTFRTARVELRKPLGRDLFADGDFLATAPLSLRVERAAVRVLGNLAAS